MFYFQTNAAGKLSAIATEVPHGEHGKWETRHNIVTLSHAERIAAEATELTGDLYVGIDNGPSVWPRYDLIKAPKVGDKVSYAFNGDYYPDGEIVSVTPGSLRQVKTSTGHTYYRRKQTGNWKQTGGTWSLVPGHINERNPEF